MTADVPRVLRVPAGLGPCAMRGVLDCGRRGCRLQRSVYTHSLRSCGPQARVARGTPSAVQYIVFGPGARHHELRGCSLD
jgi:hypothetical protein